MQQKEIVAIIILSTAILSAFIAGIIIFIIQYRKRKVLHEKEKQMINELHGKELLATQIEIQQQTMQDLGREIHDNIAQRLTLATIYAQQFVFENQYPGANEKIDAITSVIHGAIAELRSLSRTLTNDYIQQTALAALVQAECERVQASGKCNVVYQLTQANIPLDETRKKVTLRIIQEFFQNSLKHSNCRTISISLQFAENQLTIVAKDDGRGFNTAAIAKERNGIGLENMRKRAELIGAKFSITSKADEGTEINFTLSVQ